MNAFIAQHKCNYICQGLKLSILSEKTEDPVEEDELEGDYDDEKDE
jgi:hypothetical protein